MSAPKVHISIIIPVWKEETRILDTLSHLSQLTGIEQTEVILAIGDHEGNYPAHFKGLKLRRRYGISGRATQMNEAALEAEGEILVFLHSDTLLPPCALAEISDTLTHYSAGAFSLRIKSLHPLLYLTGWVTSLRCRISRIPFGDQALFFTRECFFHEQGFPSIPIMEDIGLMKRLRTKRIPIKILSSAVLTSGRRWEKEGWLFCTVRNWILRILQAVSVSPSTLSRWYPRR